MQLRERKIIVMKKSSKFVLILLGLTFTMIVSFVKYLTGPELALSAFYLLSIAVVTWYVGIRAGIFISVASALSWLTADLMMLNTFSNPVIPYFNESFRLIVFLIITVTLHKLRNSLTIQRELARTDHLTGIANRRAFFELANMELKKARRYGHSLSVLYLDIDNFKMINDNHGHRIGDQLLGSVAMSIKRNIRSFDLIARFGGDEFCVLLSETGAESARLIANKLQEKLTVLVEDKGWPVTFSIGAVTSQRPPDSIDEMITAADALMYSAKQNGKNGIRYKVIGKDSKNNYSSTHSTDIQLPI